MHFLRNPEIQRDLYFFIIIEILAVAFGFIIGIEAAAGMGVTGLLIGGYFFYVTRWRYKKLFDLAAELDRVLHGEAEVRLDRYTEGELAILENELHKMLRRLQEQTEALEKDKLFLADLIADISHQIRTPLTSLRLFCSLMKKEDLPQSRRRELVGEIMRILDRMDWLIESLLKMSKLDSGTAVFRQDNVMVEDLIFKASELVAIPMEVREQKLEVDMKGDEAYTGDLYWSVEAIGNIMKNCMEHMDNGGSIQIKVLENTLYTEILIRDHGHGLDPEDIGQLFDRFYRGKNAASQSIGIGLALARMIIKEQNGTVKAENAEGGGALFTVRFYKTTV